MDDLCVCAVRHESFKHEFQTFSDHDFVVCHCFKGLVFCVFRQ